MSNSPKGSTSTNWTDFLKRDLVKSGSRERWVQTFAIALKYDRRLSGIATERSVKFQSDLGFLTSNHGLSLGGKKVYMYIVFYHWELANPKSRKMNPVLAVSHYNDVIMGTMAHQITSLTIVYSTVFSGADQRKHQSSVSLAFVWGLHRWPVNSPHKRPVTRKMFPFDDVIMSPLRFMGKQWFYTRAWVLYHFTR